MSPSQRKGARVRLGRVQPAPALQRAVLASPQFRGTEHGIVRLAQKAGLLVEVPVTNFLATVKNTRVLDDGIENKREFEIAAEFMGRRFEFTLSASQFLRMAWPIEHIGPAAMIFPNEMQYARAAIQSFSTNASEERVHTHTGWVKIDGSWLYLHADGAIGKNGQATAVKVRLSSDLSRYKLNPPVDANQLVQAVRASLRLLELAPPAVSFPLHAATFRAVFGESDFSIHLVGQTGSFKSELAALEQQHFGLGMHRLNLPGSWSSTAIALELASFYAKDALFTIDEFVPHGSGADVARYHAAADRIFRAVGNHAGRGRLDSAARPKEAKAPRALILSTGEDVPRGHSVRARVLILEMPKDAVTVAKLTECQRDAGAGLYVVAMTGFLQWMAQRYERLQTVLGRRAKELRSLAMQATIHPRTPDILGNLQAGFETYLQFAEECGAIANAERAALADRCWDALLQVVAAQDKHHTAAEPAAMFLALLRGALVSGHAHLANRSGDEPDRSPETYGWRRNSYGNYSPRGDCIGWVDGDDIYLEPTAAYRVVYVAGRAMGDVLPVSGQTVRKRLHEKGMLASVDVKRETLTIRRRICGVDHDVLHFHRATLFPLQSCDPEFEDEAPEEAGDVGFSSRENPAADVDPDDK